MADKEFYRTTVTVTFLSDRPTDDIPLSVLINDADYGDMVRGDGDRTSEKIDSKAMADALIEADSDPSFFGLDEDGNEADL